MANTLRTPESYLSRLQGLGVDAWSLETKIGKTRVFYTDESSSYPINSPTNLIATAKLAERGSTSICVIENISAEWVSSLGAAWDIDPSFFATHASKHYQDTPWQKDFDFGWDHDALSRESGSPSKAVRPSFLRGPIEFVDGIFRYDNASAVNLPSHVPRVHSKGECPVQSTRITYCRPNIWMYLFLVDGPLELPGYSPCSNDLPALRFPYALNTGGLQLPRLLSEPQNKYSIYELLQTFCQHPWHHKLLFDLRPQGIDKSHNVMPGSAFIYLFASCLWEENLSYLDKEIKRISFREIRNPKLETNNVLHDKREDLARLKDELVRTAMHVPSEIENYFETYWSGGEYYSRIKPNVTQHFERLIADTNKLEAFLMETFTLFMSSISVQDTHRSMDQAQRGSRLTILAFIYVPLSFVTGVFGMNIQQINGSGLDIWVCFVVLVAVIFLTVPVFLTMKLSGDRKANDSSV
ncbi:hypothetical protein B0I35DRAFT_444968 [Stachybotrys elegans]|uniref:Uncharacterized protein n=1 Tax=Stachybotrys elegans TaxID=80388 RepID=A0A8K0WKD5_9HYPO|nr:hypothetical protein B0I35DRAFT_444968 [Stachybotrys elegans]